MNKNCCIKNKHIIALLLIIISPVVAPYLDTKLSELSLIAGETLPRSSQPHSTQKTQTIFLNTILNEDFIPVLSKDSLVEKDSIVPFFWEFVDSNSSMFFHYAISIGMLNLMYAMSFVSYPQMLISYIHKMDGKKDREYLFAYS